jgi:hypothetical protein
MREENAKCEMRNEECGRKCEMRNAKCEMRNEEPFDSRLAALPERALPKPALSKHRVEDGTKAGLSRAGAEHFDQELPSQSLGIMQGKYGMPNVGGIMNTQWA